MNKTKEINELADFYEKSCYLHYGYREFLFINQDITNLALECLKHGDVIVIEDYIDRIMMFQRKRDKETMFNCPRFEAFLYSYLNMTKNFPEYEAKDAMLSWLKIDRSNEVSSFLLLMTSLSSEEVMAVLKLLSKEGVKTKNEKRSSEGIKEEKAPKKPKDKMFVSRTEIENLISVEKEKAAEELRKSVTDYIVKTYGPVEQKITLKSSSKEKIELDASEIIHEKFAEILSFVVENEPVYLVGPAGSGKNHICKQIAKVMKLPFYFSNAVTQEYKITGFTDANGIYHETQFYKAFKNGGIFMLDELDASIPEVLIILNAAIANRYFDFPAPIGYVEAHKDFRIIAAGNTWGYGADTQYVGRNQLDMASLDRFAVVNVTYSPAIEVKLCPDAELLTFLRQYRASAQKSGIETVVSYRVMSRMYIMKEKIKDKKELLDACLCKGLCKDDLLHISEGIESGKYKTALSGLIRSRGY